MLCRGASCLLLLRCEVARRGFVCAAEAADELSVPVFIRWTHSLLVVVRELYARTRLWCVDVIVLLPVVRSSATMCIALNAWPGYILAVITLLNSFFNAYVVKVHPSFKSGELSRTHVPSAAEDKDLRNGVAAIVATNPELQARAGAAIVAGAGAAAMAHATSQVRRCYCSGAIAALSCR